MSTFGRYLLREIAPLYAAGLAILLLLLLMMFLLGVLADVLARGVPPGLVARYLLLRMPAAVGTGLPLALLFATLLGLTRLTRDRELRAALTLGLSPGALLRPLLWAGVGVALLAVANNELITPRAERAAAEVEKDILLRSPDALVAEGRFFTDAMGRSLFVESLEPGGRVEGLTVLTPGSLAGPGEVIEAERGRLDEEAGVWHLEEVRMRVLDRARLSLDLRAETATLPMRGLATGSRPSSDLVTRPFTQLWERARANDDPAAWTALHRKVAEPAAAVAFAVFALAVALAGVRRESPLGFVSVLSLTFLYYATWSVSKLLGAQGTVPAYAAGWAPVALYLGVGLLVLGWTWRR